MTAGHEAETFPSHEGEVITSMARRAASRYGDDDRAVEDAQSKSGLLMSSIQRRALDLPADCMAGKKGVARGDRDELLPLQGAPISTLASA
jgi:hypothetical protein